MDHHEDLELDMNQNFLERQTDDIKTNENPEFRTAKLLKLRDLVQGPEKLPVRQDDEFLIRFLRAKQYNVSNAFHTEATFNRVIEGKEKAAWQALKNVHNFLGNQRAENYSLAINEMRTYQELVCNISLTILLMHSHFNLFPCKFGTMSDKNEDLFRQDISQWKEGIRLKHYCAFKEQNHQSMVYNQTLRSVLESGVVRVLGGRDQFGRRVLWIRVGLWAPRTCPNDILLLAGNLCTEVLSLEPVTQMAGLVVIFDLKGMGLQQLRGITPAFARRMVHYLANSSPVRVYSVHIVNEPALFTMLFAVYQKLLDERMKRRLFFHGHSLTSLHQRVSTHALPSELGGTLPEQKPHQWLNLLESEAARKELKAAGYIYPDEKHSLLDKNSDNSNSEVKINSKSV